MGKDLPAIPAVSWPRMTGRIEARVILLAAERSACSVARAHVRDFGSRHGIDVDDALSCATEILANAMRADEETPGRIGLVRLTIAAFYDSETLFVAVRDWGEGVPAMQKITPIGRIDDLPESGLGLALVDNLSAKWGVAENEHGKTVWVQLPLEFPVALPTRRAFVVPSGFAADAKVLERVVGRMRARWIDSLTQAPSPRGAV